jgi:hypothetical protein
LKENVQLRSELAASHEAHAALVVQHERFVNEWREEIDQRTRDFDELKAQVHHTTTSTS